MGNIPTQEEQEASNPAIIKIPIKEPVTAKTNESVPVPADSPTSEVVSPPLRKAAFQIHSAKRLERYLKMMIYGPYGVGKTVMSATAQDVSEMKDVLIISAESGDLSIAHRDDIDVIQISKYSQLNKIFEWLRLHVRAREANNEKELQRLQEAVTGEEVKNLSELKRYNTIVLDSLTELHKYCMYQLLGIKIGIDPLDLEPDQAQFAEWGKASEMIRLLIRSFRDLPVHAIFICAEQIRENERKQAFFSPSLPGKLSNEAQGFLDVVGLLKSSVGEDGQTNRRIYIQPTDKFNAKCRIRTIEDVHIDDPSLESFMKGLR